MSCFLRTTRCSSTGVALGSAFGGIAQAAFVPTGLSVAAPAAYALVGVAAMLAANCQVPLTAVLLLFELTHDYFIIVPTLAAVGISYWTASLPIAAGISARLQANAGADVGAGSVASVDEDDLILGEPLLPQIKIPGFAPAKLKDGGGEQAR
jgi:H+/Cl- antiporter ClcA